MDFLELPFKLLTITGFWKPLNWNTWRHQLIWIPFSIVTITLVSLQLTSQIGYLMMAKSLTEFNERLFFIPTGISTIQKIFILIIRRNQLIDLSNMFLTDLCIPRNAEEILIESEYKDIIRSVGLACFILVNLTGMNLASLPIFMGGIGNGTLPMKVWLPYPLKSEIVYWISYVHQTLGIFCVGTGAVGSTLVIIGFMYQVCAQYHILGYRFYMLPHIIKKFRKLNVHSEVICQFEKKAFKQNVQYHLYIFRLAKTVNDTFKSVILQQFCLSAIVVSATIYQLSTRPDKNVEFLMVLFYLMCVLTEFLVYCWFGNELMLESLNFQDVVYSIDWSILSTTSGKSLFFIMLRATKPVIMYCGHFIVLSLESYIGILKVSYSVFNILRRSIS